MIKEGVGVNEENLMAEVFLMMGRGCFVPFGYLEVQEWVILEPLKTLMLVSIFTG